MMQSAPHDAGTAVATVPPETRKTERTARLLVRTLAVLLAVLLAVALGLTAGDPTLEGSDLAFGVIVAVGLTSFATIGLIIAAKAPTNPIGWLYAIGGLGVVMSVTANGYAIRASTDLDLPGAGYAQFMSAVLGPPSILTLALALLLFPTGTLASRRWRVVRWAIAVAAGASITAVFTTRTFEAATDVHVANPLFVPGTASWDWIASLAGITGLAAGLGAFASIVVRYLRARDVERLQIRWLAFAVAMVVMSWILLLVAGESAWGNALWLMFSTTVLVGLPAATAVAVLRYRLYELDIVIRKAAVFLVLALGITAVLLLAGVALGGSLTSERNAAGAVVTAFVLGALVVPAWRLARRIADRLVFGGRTSPYEALTVFAGRLSETYATDDVLPRMAALVAEVTRASRTRVWIGVGDELHPAATWPPGDLDPAPVRMPGSGLPTLPDAHHAAEIRDRGELLGALTATFPANDPVGAGRRGMMDDLAAQAGPVLRNVRLIEELRASRRRIVGAQDARAKKLERDIHDGAQQQLVALAVKLRLATQTIDRDPAKAKDMLATLQRDAGEALDTLRDLARGIYPPLLADEGLAAALEAQARKAPIPTTVRSDAIGRYAQETEAGVYFCALEAIANASKYSGASALTLDLAQRSGSLRFAVTDDGRGFDASSAPGGSGLQGMIDRIDAIGGTLEIRSEPGGGTTVAGSVPVPPAAEATEPRPSD